MQQPSPAELLHILETSPLASLLCDEVEILYANAACVALLGYSEAADVCALHPLPGVVAPPDQRAFREALRRLLQGTSPGEELSVSVCRADGTTFPARVCAQSLSDRDLRRAFVTLLDATDRRAEARDLNRLARAVNLISEAVLIADGDSTIVYANGAMGALLDASDDALIGVPALSLLPDSQDVNTIIDSLRVSPSDKHITVGVELRTLTGRTFPAEVSVTVFREPDDGREMGIVIARDLTDARRLEQDRQLRERQLGSMLREAHHRIKNNLQVASDILALQASGGPPEVRGALEAATRRIRALAAVHEGIRADQDVTEVQARPLIEAVVQDLEDPGEPTEAPIRFETALEEHAVTSRAASALALITAELVTNALQHGRPRVVRVGFRATDGLAVLEVCDNAPHAEPEPATPGTGFGLRLVRLLAEEQLRGEFSLACEAGWTTAQVRFPLRGEPD